MKTKINQTYTLKFINKLIATNAEESLNLEFKSAESLDFDNKKTADENKTELSRDVSAMANSAGGLIIYGIREENHIAKTKSFLNGSIITKERIEQVLQSRIKRPISNLKIIPIREDHDLKKTIYVIIIPESEDSPHMAFDGVYYKRNNFNRIRAEEYEIRREYLRIRKSILVVDLPVINDVNGNFIKKGEKEQGHFRIWFHIRNIGAILDSNFKLIIHIPESIHVPYYMTPNEIEKYKTHSLPGYHRFAVPSEQTIFPAEQLRIISSHINLKEENMDEKIKITLFYTGGTDEKFFTIREMFFNQNKNEDEYNFKLNYQNKI
jgi:hypothetical protein